MKILFTTTKHGIDIDLDQVCPFHNKIKDREHPYIVGSIACTSCPYCYGYGEHPNPLHNQMLVPAYSRFSKENNKRSDLEIAEDGLKGYKFMPDTSYVKCMMAYSEYGRSLRKNRFKLWYWKHIGKKVSELRCNLIEKYYDLKFKFFSFIN